MFLGDVLNICETTNVQSYSLVHNIYSSKGLEIIFKYPSIKILVNALLFNYTVEFCRDKRKRGSFCALVNYLQDDENMFV